MRESMAQVEAIVLEALSVQGAQRQHVVDRACGNNHRLRHEVESLLANADHARTFLSTPLIDPHRFEDDGNSNIDKDLHRDVGPYRLVERIGSGGMGNVYRAVRRSGEFDQTVAIKLIRQNRFDDDAPISDAPSSPSAGPDIIARFRVERQILANLNHPNIARLIDGGSTDDGRPFIVMEQVQGERIDRYCDAHRLTIRSRIELFRIVCDAVQYAHRNLVVHRDLKPSNVLVADDPAGGAIVKLLDFGIAKVLREDRVADRREAAERTQAGDHRLTPAYASPEQVKAEAITTASDVYSLGVVLYELLCGRKPYDFGTGSAADMERAICQTPPTSMWTAATRTHDAAHSARGEPSALEADPDALEAICAARSTDPARLRRELSSDLEKIIMLALRKEPDRRYPTVEAFSEDLRRYLAGQPVAAQADSWGYRARKFIERNRVAVGIAGVMALILLAATLVSAAAMVRAQRAQAQAQATQRSASAVASYLREMLKSIDPLVAQGRDADLVRDMLDETSARLAAGDGQVLAPREAAELHEAVAAAYQSIGEYQHAADHLEQAIANRQSLEMPTLELADAWHAHSSAMWELSRRDLAEQSILEALAIQNALLDPAHPIIGRSLAMHGHIVTSDGQYERGEPMLREGIDIMRAAERAHHPQFSSAALASALGWLGDVLSDQRRPLEAQPLLLEARDRLIELHGEAHPTIAVTERALGWACRRIGGAEHIAQAVTHFERALEIERQFFAPDHPRMGYSLNGYASALEDAGRLDDALAAYIEAEGVLRVTIGQGSQEYGTLCNNIGNLYRKLERYDDAVPLLQQAADVYARTRSGGADDMWVSFPLLNLARAQVDAGRPAQAMIPAGEALRIRRLHLQEDDDLIDQALIILAEAMLSQGVETYPQIERDLLAAHDRMQARFGDDHPGTAMARAALARLYEAWNRP